jgi:hypothetical protein
LSASHQKSAKFPHFLQLEHFKPGEFPLAQTLLYIPCSEAPFLLTGETNEIDEND